MPCSACQQKTQAAPAAPPTNLNSNNVNTNSNRTTTGSGVASSAGGVTSSAGGVASSAGGVTSSAGGVTSSAGGLASSAGGLASTNRSTRTSSEDLRAASLDAGRAGSAKNAGATGSAGRAASAMASDAGGESGKSDNLNSSFDPRDYAQGTEAMSGDAEKAMMGFITQLSERNFDSAIGSDLSFIKFFVPWCGHCLRLGPIWEALAAKADGGKVKIAEVDCSKNGKLCDREKVDGYPTLVLFKNGKRLQEYSGKRTVSELYAFVQKHSQ